MDSKLLARIGAIAFVAVAITMTALKMRETRQASPERAVAIATEPDPDPLRAELIRCQSIGEAGASDVACLRAWAKNRRRFLAPGSRPKERLSSPTQASE